MSAEMSTLVPLTRRFNVSGPCDPHEHYMLPPERRLREIDEGTAKTASWDEVRRRIGR